jgi:nitroreductase
MMFLSLIRERRSIRRYENRAVEQEKIHQLLEAALRAPSSMSRSPWSFILVQEPETLARMAEMKPHGSSFLRHAPLAIVVCADPKKSDVWVEDTAITATFIQLAAQSMGLGSCWIQVRERFAEEGFSSTAFLRKVLKLPESLTVSCVIAAGYPAEQKAGHAPEELLWDRVHKETHGTPWQRPSDDSQTL